MSNLDFKKIWVIFTSLGQFDSKSKETTALNIVSGLAFRPVCHHFAWFLCPMNREGYM